MTHYEPGSPHYHLLLNSNCPWRELANLIISRLFSTLDRTAFTIRKWLRGIFKDKLESGRIFLLGLEGYRQLGIAKTEMIYHGSYFRNCKKSSTLFFVDDMHQTSRAFKPLTFALFRPYM